MVPGTVLYSTTVVLQYCKVTVKAVLSATPRAAFGAVASLLLPHETNVLVRGGGDLAVDFGTECAGWI